MSETTYAAPKELKDVVTLLADNPGSHILAGGQNLLVEPGRSRIAGSLLVDLRRIAELSGIQAAADGGIRIGATTTIGAIAASELVRNSVPVLADTAGLVGDAQVRNRATLGGALAEADPGSDLIPVLMVLNAVVGVEGRKSRSVPAGEFFTGPNRTALSAEEVITGITIPAPGGSTGASYEKMKDPATLYAICGVAASVTLSAQGLVTQCRVAVTGSTEYPVRLSEVEAALNGAQPGDQSLVKAVSVIDGRLKYRGTYYASSEYRGQLTRVLAERALRRAAAAAAQRV